MMMRSIVLITFLLPLAALSQEKTKYFTREYKPCPPDSAWIIKKGTPDGNKWHVYEYWKYYTTPYAETWFLDSNFTVPDGEYIEYSRFPDKKVHTRGQCSNGQRVGLWLSVYESGKPEDSIYYHEGHIVRYLSHYENGRLQKDDRTDSTGKGLSRGFWEDGRPEHNGQFTQWKKTGIWAYYTRQGVLCARETMNADTVSSALFYDDKGKNPTVIKKDFSAEADYPGGEGRWLYYINKTLGTIKMPDAFMKDEIQGTVVVSFSIDTAGNVVNPKVVQSLHPDMDSLSVQVVQSSSGKWIPGRNHNRLVESYKMQPFTFRLTAE